VTVEISAILTTYNRAQLLPRVLAGLQTQKLAHDRFEIVAVDDGSTDATQSVLAAWERRLPLRVARQRQAGIAAAKNLGVFLARGPILVFLDDDDVADPNLLTAHLAAHIANPDPAVAVLGYTSLAPEVASVPLMHHVTEVGCQLFSYSWMKPGQVLSYTEFWGGRSSCKRRLLVRHGVFHPDFRFGCEDIELGWRLVPQGFRVIHEPAARSVMIRSLTFDQFCARSYRQGRSQHRFAELHDDPKVRHYCEIDAALTAWRSNRSHYATHMRWTRKLDELALARRSGGLPVHALLRETLDVAYRDAFFLSRCKGIADAAEARGAGVPIRSSPPTRLLEQGLRPVAAH
jgi:GT2 family glycosyltransferase